VIAALITVAVVLGGLLCWSAWLFDRERQRWETERNRLVSALLLSTSSPQAAAAVVRPQGARAVRTGEPIKPVLPEGM
jgi:hypothetical protein